MTWPWILLGLLVLLLAGLGVASLLAVVPCVVCGRRICHDRCPWREMR